MLAIAAPTADRDCATEFRALAAPSSTVLLTRAAPGATTLARSLALIDAYSDWIPPGAIRLHVMEAAAVRKHLPDGDSGPVRNLGEEFVERIGEPQFVFLDELKDHHGGIHFCDRGDLYFVSAVNGFFSFPLICL
jgi:hypothetical protein